VAKLIQKALEGKLGREDPRAGHQAHLGGLAMALITTGLHVERLDVRHCCRRRRLLGACRPPTGVKHARREDGASWLFFSGGCMTT